MTFKPFLSGMYNIDVLRNRQNIISQLTEFVVENLRDNVNPRDQHSSCKPFVESVNSTMFELSQPWAQLTKRQQSLIDNGDTTGIVLDAFEKVMKWNHISDVIAPPFQDKHLYAAFVERFNAHVEKWDKTDPSIQGAYNMAKLNMIRAHTRATCMSVIVTLLKRSDYSNPAIANFNVIREHLYTSGCEFSRQMLLFGGLLGGDFAKEALKVACNRMAYDPKMSIDYSVIHYLSRDGVSPGSWPTAHDVQFRDEIKKAYEQL